jgi:hypothetical protein
MGYNSTTGQIDQYTASGWTSIATSAGLSTGKAIAMAIVFS